MDFDQVKHRGRFDVVIKDVAGSRAITNVGIDVVEGNIASNSDVREKLDEISKAAGFRVVTIDVQKINRAIKEIRPLAHLLGISLVKPDSV
ncbi:MAG TPA: hypothetical protein VER55_08205, partial [Ardenticatenaceae bacterium]|nr:hypothetical protein [Ardenticatenaceae bacterium]